MEIIKRAAKRLTSLLVVMAMVFSMMPNLGIEVHAVEGSTTVVNLGVNGGSEWTVVGDTITGKVQSTTTMGCTSQKDATLTLKNNNQVAATLSFDWSSSNMGSVSIDGQTAVSGNYSKELAAGATITITIKSHKDNTSVSTLTLSNITLIIAGIKYTTVFKASPNGSYTVTATDGTSYQVVSEDLSLTKDSNVRYTLNAVANNGYNLGGWADKDNTLLSTSNPFNYTAALDGEIAPIFYDANNVALFGVGSHVYTDLQMANDYAVANNINKIVLLRDGTLPAGNYTISKGVTLLIPRDEVGTVDGAEPPCVDGVGVSIYRTLYMASGAHLTVNGELYVAGQHSFTQGHNGTPYGPVGHIVMQSDSTITMESGANLYVWGYISGSGSITAKSGSKVYENFQLRDYRGGRATVLNMMNNDEKVLPMSQYYLQNVEVLLTYEAGAKAYAYMSASLPSLTASGGTGATVPVIGEASNAMFLLSEGTLTKDFDESTGRTVFTLKGKIAVAPMSISMSVYTVKSENYFMPIPGHITIDVLGGSSITLNQDVALLPGSELYIRNGARCMVESGKSIIVYDVDDWGGYCGHLNHRNSDLPYAPGMVEGADPNREKDALIQVDGEVDASKGYVYTTVGGAYIYGTGQVKTTPGTATVTYQAVQADSSISYDKIGIIPAVLQNPGKAPTETAGSDSNTNFYWNSVCGMWTKGPAEGFVPGHVDAEGDKDHKCDFCGAVASEHHDNPGDGDHLCEECGQDAGTCVDTDKNHRCDTESSCTYWNTGDKACHDGEDNDHKCDWCNATIEECYDSDDGNHDCDECMQPATQCQDENKDHICDTDSKCGEYNVGSYGHTAGADGHRCNYCGKAASTCVDGDYDHVCDLGCGNTQVNWERHADASGDRDHLCDYGCGQTVSVCTDEDVKDHKCDECQAVLSECADSDDKDHNCDHCGAKIEDCSDVNPSDHFCDECGAPMGTVCADNNSDHLCDICSKELTKCADVNGDGDHKCDLCGAENVTACVDIEKDGNHNCDECGAENVTECFDSLNDGDHKCDECGADNMNECADVNNDGDHKCDECGAEAVTECGDSEKNHICDTDSACTVYNSGDNAHKDSATDDDHICDYCQNENNVLEDCADCVWNYADNANGTHDASCSVCGEQMEDDKLHVYDVTGKCACANTAEAKIGETYYCFFTDAVAAAQNGQTVVLCKDVTLSQKLTVETVQVWALGENTLKTANGDENYSLVVKGHLTVNSGKIVVNGWYGIGVLGQMTINGGEFAYEGYNDYLIGNWGTLVVNGGTFNGQYCCVNNFNGTTTINGGTFITEATDDSGEYESETLLANNGLSVFGGSFSTDVTAFCDAEHHTVKGESGYYEYGAHADCELNYTDNGDGSHDAHCSGCGMQMIDDEKHSYNVNGACVCENTAQAKIGETYYCFFTDAVAAAQNGQTVVLCKDVTLSQKLTVETEQVWALGAYTLKTANGDENYSLVVKGNLTVNSGKIVVTGWYGIGVLGQMTINSGEFAYEGYNDYLIGNWGTLVVNGGTFNGQYCCVNNFSGTTTINGGKFTTKATDASGEFDSCDLMADAGLTVKGGEFSKDVTYYCEKGFHTVDVDSDSYLEWGAHEFTEGLCACGYIQDLHISLVIKADEMDPYEQIVNDIKYGNNGQPLEIVLDFSKIDLTCITLGDASLTIGGKEDVPYLFEDGKFIIASELITGDIAIVVQAVQRHEVGDVVMENYQAADFEHNESYDLVAYCAKCGLAIKTTHYEFEGTQLHAVAQIGSTKYESLEEAIAAANMGDTIVLLEKVVVEGTKVWDLTGITVKIADVGYDYGLIVRDELTINGGNFVMEGFYGIGVAATGKLTVNGGNFSVAGDNDYLIGSYGTVVINGGTFVGQYNCVNGFQGTVTVNGGDFTVAETDCTGDYESEPVQGYATVYGGVFNNAYVADYLAEGYCLAVQDGKFVVGQHIAGDAVVENVVDATCTEKGSYDSVTYCAHCGEEMSRKAVSVEMLEHTANETVAENRKDATCTEKGSYDNVTYCACGEELNRETVEIPATGHVAGEAVIENVNNATCTAGGSYDVATYCVTCNEKLSSKTIETDALGHNWVPHTAEPATCTAAGWEQHICSVCSTLSEKATIPATGHTMGKVVTENKVEPTCTKDGSYDMVVYCATCSCEISRTAVSVAATGHKYVKTVVAPTCTQMGYTTYTCACGHTYDADYVPVISHSYEMEVTLAPTCTQKGVRTYTCSSCGHTKTEEIAATGHAWDTGVETKPTCTEGGYTTYTCTTCGSSYETNYTAATGHTWDEGAVDYAPTCTGDGRLVYTCACGAKRHEKIDAIGHDYRATVTDPTCTTDGYTTHTCANCGDSYVDSRVDALGHSWGDDVVTKPTCTAEGYTTHTCTVCSYSYVDSRVPATGHNYNDVVNDPTCTTDGYTSHTCVVCGHAYTDGVVPATGHNYDEKVTLAPGCTTRGEKTHTCINCGDAYVEPIAATGHKYEADVIPPTCTIPGYTSYVCSVCGDAYDGDDVPATGHTYKAVVTAPTCTEEGYTTYTCSVCNYSYEADPVAPTGHAIGQIVTENYKAPTCTEDGSYDMVIYCATCDEAFSRTAWTIEATGHQYVVTKTAPTCTEKGYTTYTCACGDSYIADYVDALGHVYETKVTEPTCTEKGYTTYTCHCGDSYVADYVDALGHVYETKVTKPTCTEKGYTTYTCHCGDSYIADYVDALGHTAGEPVKEYGEDGTYYDEVVYCAECGEELSRVRVDLYVLGDVNGDGEIDVLDAMLVAQYIVGDIGDEDIVVDAADVNGDGEIDVLDAMMIAQYIVGDVTSFPAEEEKKS